MGEFPVTTIEIKIDIFTDLLKQLSLEGLELLHDRIEDELLERNYQEYKKR